MTAEKTINGIPARIGEAGAFIGPTSDPKYNLAGILQSLAAGRPLAPTANLAAIKGISANDRSSGMVALNQATGEQWIFAPGSSATADDVLVAAPSAGSGRWVRAPGEIDIYLPIGFGTADAAILMTLPTGAVFEPWDFNWNVTVGFTGGASSAIGLSSSNIAGHTTKGDLLGGASGELTAAIGTAGWKRGTIGTNWATVANRRVLMLAGDNIRFDRITSAYTAGAGFAVVNGYLHASPT